MGKIKLSLKKYRILIVVVITVIVLIGIGFGTYKYNKVQAYNNLVTTANKYMAQGDYDKAEALFEQSLKYKKDSSIEKNIKLATTLKKFKGIYNDGMKLVNDKKYLESIEKFKTIDKNGLKWYTDAQKEITECKKQYIVQNLKLADNAFKSNKYDDANEYLDGVLRLDSNNADAKKLKNSILEAISQNQKNSELVEQAKQVSQSNAGQTNVQNSNTSNGETNEYSSKISDIDNEIKTVESSIEDCDYELSTLNDHSEKYIQTLEKKKGLLQQKINLIQQKNELQGQIQK
ncbi:tetratricopeptide repeat protein [Clostridium sp. LBM24168]